MHTFTRHETGAHDAPPVPNQAGWGLLQLGFERLGWSSRRGNSEPARLGWLAPAPIQRPVQALLITCTLTAGCSFSTYGLPGGEGEASTSSDPSMSTLSNTTTPDPSTDETSTSPSTTDASASTDAMPTCGDGVLSPPEECDDDNVADGDGCSSVCTLEYRRVFATSQVFTGDLGGIAGADAKCQEAANVLDRPGLFRAWISSGTDSPATNFVRSKVPYVDLDGQQIAADWNDLTDGMLADGIYKTETGDVPPESTCSPTYRVAWTNTSTEGQSLGSELDCAGWMTTSAQGGSGRLGYATPTWTNAEGLSCTCLASLYCVEQ